MFNKNPPLSKMRAQLLLFAVLLFFCTKSFCKKYENYTLFRGMPVNEDHLDFFRNLSDVYEVGFWRMPSTVNRPVDFVVPPEVQKKFVTDAESHDIYLTTLIEDLQTAFDKQTVKSYIRRNMASFNWQNFYRLKDIYNWLTDLAKAYPKEMNVFSIGKTYENRHIYGVSIILKGSKRRSKVMIEGGIHAREWIGSAFVTYMINEIIHAPTSKNKDLLDIAMTYEWYFVPVLNPDGYEYTHTEDRLWRKNRNAEYGVDINRNFGFGFGSIGVSPRKQDAIYCGPHAFSEKESQAMAEFVRSQSAKLEYYLAFHSYGQFMVIPYAHSSQHQDNFDEVKNMGMYAGQIISRRFGTKYTVGTAYDTVGYKTSGVSGCWVKRTFGVPYVVTFELRDNGKEGFALDPSKILPTCKETMDGLLTFLRPRRSNFQKMKLQPLEPESNDQKNTILDGFVLVCNVLLFIIVRFD